MPTPMAKSELSPEEESKCVADDFLLFRAS